jgi:hypothetical protein
VPKLITGEVTGAVALAGKWAQSPTVCVLLDGEGEFGKDCCDPVSRVEIDGQFVVTAAQVLDECVSCTDHSG